MNLLDRATYQCRYRIKHHFIFAIVARSISFLKNIVFWRLLGSKRKLVIYKNPTVFFKFHTAIQYCNAINIVLCNGCPYSYTSTTLLSHRKVQDLILQIVRVVFKSIGPIQIELLFIQKERKAPPSAPMPVIFS